MKKILLGIDPSFVNLGMAIYDPERKTYSLKTTEFPKAAKWIQTELKAWGYTMNDVIAVVENPALDSTVFNMWGMVKAEIEDAVFNMFVKMKFFGPLVNAFRFAGLTQKKATRPKGLITDREGHPKTFADVQSKFLIAMKYAQSVGENKAAAKLFIRLLTDAGVPVIEVAPSARDKAYKQHGKKTQRLDPRFLKMPTKTNSEQFQQLTGYEGQSNEHNRDAATLVWNKNIRWAENQVLIEEAKNKKRPASLPGRHNYHVPLSSWG